MEQKKSFIRVKSHNTLMGAENVYLRMCCTSFSSKMECWKKRHFQAKLTDQGSERFHFTVKGTVIFGQMKEKPMRQG